jgi:putative oxygen-independent coproporphyrinogen III oxidase
LPLGWRLLAGAPDAASRVSAPSPFGVYVHVPFCASRCDYCAFATWTDRHHLHAAYVDACVAELRSAALPPATSVFFGGGTPSLLRADLLTSILDAIDRAPGAEVTVECNPDTVDEALLTAYRSAGVTRLSFGVQSMVPHVLRSLGRTHDVAAVARCASLAWSLDFASWSMDLIHGAAGESVDDWRRTLDAVLALDPPHLSAYALTVEAGTPLAADPSRHPDDDDEADKYVVTEAACAAAGLTSYEISNWAATPMDRCRHNLLYWRQGDYRGIGCAAHSHVAGRRWWNVRTPDRYIEAMAAGAPVEAASETLDAATRRLEGLQLALRMATGVPATALAPADGDELRQLGLVEPAPGDRVRLTLRGRLLANEVALRLVAV